MAKMVQNKQKGLIFIVATEQRKKSCLAELGRDSPVVSKDQCCPSSLKNTILSCFGNTGLKLIGSRSKTCCSQG